MKWSCCSFTFFISDNRFALDWLASTISLQNSQHLKYCISPLIPYHMFQVLPIPRRDEGLINFQSYGHDILFLPSCKYKFHEILVSLKSFSVFMQKFVHCAHPTEWNAPRKKKTCSCTCSGLHSNQEVLIWLYYSDKNLLLFWNFLQSFCFGIKPVSSQLIRHQGEDVWTD